jgi:hypothetical protein
MSGRARTGLRVGLVVAFSAACAWPLPSVALAFSRIYCPLANVVLSNLTFGERGHARTIPLSRIERREGDNVTADALVSLTVDGFKGDLPLGVSLRRDVYLPLLLALLVIALSGLSLRRRLVCAAIAVPVVLGAGVAANGLVAAWTFATQLRGLYPPGTAHRRFLELAYSALLSPPGNRFIAPILLGAGLVLWHRLRARPLPAPDLPPARVSDPELPQTFAG